MKQLQVIILAVAVVVLIAGVIALNTDIAYAAVCTGGASCEKVCRDCSGGPDAQCTYNGINMTCYGSIPGCPIHCLLR